MRSFDEIYTIAADRKGGPEALEAEISKSTSQADLASTPDDRILAGLTKHVFCAGFNWNVVESMWPGFEAAFHGFDIGKCAMMDDAWFDELVADTRIVRYGAKILSVRDNAVLLQELAAEKGSAANFLASWPSAEYAGLLELLKKRGNRLGGTTGQYGLRVLGRDSYILTQDVVARLVAEGVIDKAPTSKKAMTAVQDAFNIWMDQSGRGLTPISRVLAMSV